MRTIHYAFKMYATPVSFVMLGLLLFTGCASTSPSATFLKELPYVQRVDANDTTTVHVAGSDDVILLEYDKRRLAQKIQCQIDALKAENVGVVDIREYELDVRVTRYDKGNAFARFMLAGLGQIHIDATISVLVLPSRDKVAEFKIDKTFAWGGLYGSATSIQDVEDGFAEGVAEAVIYGQ